MKSYVDMWEINDPLLNMGTAKWGLDLVLEEKVLVLPMGHTKLEEVSRNNLPKRYNL